MSIDLNNMTPDQKTACMLAGLKWLEELTGKASEAQSRTIRVVNATCQPGCWNIIDGGDRGPFLTAATLIEKLRKLTIPPKPKTVMIEVPYEHAEYYSMLRAEGYGQHTQSVSNACREAIKQYEEQQP